MRRILRFPEESPGESSQRCLVHPAIQCIQGPNSPVIKLSEWESDHSSSSSAEVKNVKSFISIPHTCLYGVVLRHKHVFQLRFYSSVRKFTLTLTI